MALHQFNGGFIKSLEANPVEDGFIKSGGDC